jgi:hypothetical protein
VISKTDEIVSRKIHEWSVLKLVVFNYKTVSLLNQMSNIKIQSRSVKNLDLGSAKVWIVRTGFFLST